MIARLDERPPQRGEASPEGRGGKMKKLLAVMFVVPFAIVFSACGNAPKITRTDASAQIDLSGFWNDTDSQMVSQEMVQDSVARPWLSDFMAQKNVKPVVTVGTVLNKSSEHINTDTFIEDLERELTNSGKVRFVASKESREELRQEKIDQAQNASLVTAKSAGQEHGADYMLQGQINTIMDQAANTSLKYYQVDLELVDISTNEKVWIGQKKIKKLVEQKKRRL